MSQLDIIQEVETSTENEEEEDDITAERDIEQIFDENTRIELREAYHSIRHKKDTSLRRHFSKKRSQKPGENAHASNQGDLWTCTLHSIGKAIVDGCQDKVFRKDVVIDLKQKDVIDTLHSHYVERLLSKERV